MASNKDKIPSKMNYTSFRISRIHIIKFTDWPATSVIWGWLTLSVLRFVANYLEEILLEKMILLLGHSFFGPRSTHFSHYIREASLFRSETTFHILSTGCIHCIYSHLNLLLSNHFILLRSCGLLCLILIICFESNIVELTHNLEFSYIVI